MSYFIFKKNLSFVSFYMMEIYVQYKNRVIWLKVSKELLIENVKERINDQLDIDPNQQLLFKNGELEDKKKLDQYGIENNSMIELYIKKADHIIIYINCLTGVKKAICINKKAHVYKLKEKLFNLEGIPVDKQGLINKGLELDDDRTLEEYDIKENSLIHLVLRLPGGGCTADNFSGVIKKLEDCVDQVCLPCFNRLNNIIVRNTNTTGVYSQEGGTCYAYAACSAYINTIMRIYGSKPPPTFEECFYIAAYNGPNGGRPENVLNF